LASGCIPVVIEKGGQKEIVFNEINGFLWTDQLNFMDVMKKVIQLSDIKKKEIKQNGLKGLEQFSVGAFNRKLDNIINKLNL